MAITKKSHLAIDAERRTVDHRVQRQRGTAVGVLVKEEVLE